MVLRLHNFHVFSNPCFPSLTCGTPRKERRVLQEFLEWYEFGDFGGPTIVAAEICKKD
jgi:hypothetical protein